MGIVKFGRRKKSRVVSPQNLNFLSRASATHAPERASGGRLTASRLAVGDETRVAQGSIAASAGRRAEEEEKKDQSEVSCRGAGGGIVV